MKSYSKMFMLLSGCFMLTHSVFAEDLMDIYKEALTKDTMVNQAKANADSAHAKITQATAALLPKIDVVGNLSKTNTNHFESYGTNGNNTKSTIGITLAQSIWKHSNWVNKTIAEKNATLSDLSYADAQQSLILRVSTAYFNVLKAADTLKFQRANNKALKRQLDEADRKLNVGLIAETDKLEAKAAYDLSSASVINAENSLINSYEQIRLLIGRSVDVNALNKLDEKKFDTPKIAEALIELIKKAEENNIALQRAVVSRDIAKDNITLAQTGHEPTLDLNANVQTGYTKYHNPVDGTPYTSGNAWSNSIGLSLNIPIYSGGATSAGVDAATASYVAASEALENQHRILLQNINNNYNNVNAAISSVVAYNNTVISSQSALDATLAGYEVGTRTMTDVLNATQKLYDAMQKQAESRYQYIISRLTLLYNEGLLKVEHIDQINNSLKKVNL